MSRPLSTATATAPATTATTATATGAGGGRSRALDVFRGATVALMILVNNPGSWQHLYPPLAHAQWHGCTATDLVFPFFLVAVGLSLWVVTPGLIGGAPAGFWRKWLLRGLGIFAIGLALNALSLPRWQDGHLVLRGLDDWRLLGVLQRIALAWMAAALVVKLAHGRPAPVMAVAAALLLGYWGLCEALGGAALTDAAAAAAGGGGGSGAGPYSLEGFFGTGLDRALLGPRHLYQGEGVPFDPEGLASTLPAIAQVLLGWGLGQLLGPALRGAGDSPTAIAARDARLVRLFVAATAALALAQAWALAMPINKKLWTSPYVLHTSGLAMLVLGVLVHLLAAGPAAAASPAAPAGMGSAARATERSPVRRRGPTARAVLRWIVDGAEACGRNALAIFVLSGVLPRLLALVRLPDGIDAATGAPRRTALMAWVYREGFAPLAPDPRLGSLLMALVQVLAYVWLARVMARRGWFVRL